MNIFWLLVGGGQFFGWSWVVVHIFWVVVHEGGWWWIYFGWWQGMVDVGG